MSFTTWSSSDSLTSPPPRRRRRAAFDAAPVLKRSALCARPTIRKRPACVRSVSDHLDKLQLTLPRREASLSCALPWTTPETTVRPSLQAGVAGSSGAALSGRAAHLACRPPYPCQGRIPVRHRVQLHPLFHALGDTPGLPSQAVLRGCAVLDGRTWDRNRREADRLERLRATFCRSCRDFLWMPRGVRSHSLRPVFTLHLDRFGTSSPHLRRCASWRWRCCGSWRADECSGDAGVRAPLPARAGGAGAGSTAAAAAGRSRRRSHGARRVRVRSSRRSGRGTRGGGCS